MGWGATYSHIARSHLHEHYNTAAAMFLHRNACCPKLGWQCRFLRMWPASRMAQCDTRKSEIKISNFYQKSANVFSLWLNTYLYHGFRLGNTVFSHVASLLPLNFLNFIEQKVGYPTTISALCSCSWLYQCVRRVVTLVMTAQTMSFRFELACKGHSTEKAQDLVT